MVYLKTVKSLEDPVSELNLGVRVRRRLNELNIGTVCDILQFNVEDFLGKNFGRTSLYQLEDELARYDVRLKTGKQIKHEEICEAIHKAKAGGINSQTLMSEITGYGIHKLRCHARRAKISLPKGKRGVKPKIIFQRDRDITEGLSFAECGVKWNISRQGAESYIRQPDRYVIWQNAIYERLEREKEWEELEKEEAKRKEDETHRLMITAYEGAKEIGDWAYQKVVEYCILTNGKTSVPFNNLLILFENYEMMLDEDDRINYLRLSKKSKIKRKTVKKIVEKMELWLETD